MANKFLFMAQLKYFPGFILLIFVLGSCNSTKYIESTSSPTYYIGSLEQSYIDNYKDLAIAEMKRSGIPASITLAQGMIESDYGRSTLAREANNHFGIKCHSDWNGATIRYDDDARNECFRKYRHVDESYADHTDFLLSGSRYDFLFDLSPTDYASWARGLKQAGYATNPRYAEMLITKIEELGLHQYDLQDQSRRVRESRETEERVEDRVSTVGNVAAVQVPEKIDDNKDTVVIAPDTNVPQIQARTPRVQILNRVNYIEVREGETRAMIEKEFDLLNWELARYNELENNFVPYAGQHLFIQPKRDKAEVGSDTHVVKDGETIYSISQSYGVKVQKLREYNMIVDGTEPEVGRTLWLRGLRPVR